MTATKVAVVPEEEVVMEIKTDSVLDGMLVRFPTRASGNGGVGGSRDQHHRGEIDFKFEGVVYHASFASEDISPESVC